MKNMDRQTFWFVLEEAKRRGISVLSATPTGKKGRIRAERWNWAKGMAQKNVVFFADFASALRAFEHAKDSLNNRSRKLTSLAADLKSFQCWLLEKDNQSGDKREQALEQVFEFAAEFCGVRCRNLLELKGAFIGEEELTQTVEELVDDQKWNAAAAKIIYKVLVWLAEERRRLADLLPKILERRSLLFQIWQYDSARADRLYREICNFGQNYDFAVKHLLSRSELYHTLRRTLVVFDRVYDVRLKHARQALVDIGQILNSCPPNAQSRALLKKALALVRDYQQWADRDMDFLKEIAKVA